jgi:hypothetical protein
MKVEIPNYKESVKAALKKFGWDGQTAGLVVIVVTGRLVETKKLLQKADNAVIITLQLQLVDMVISGNTVFRLPAQGECDTMFPHHEGRKDPLADHGDGEGEAGH